MQSTVQAAENAIKRHEAFITTMDANDEKINAVLQFANRLIEENHFAADKIHKKAENIKERSVGSVLMHGGNVACPDWMLILPISEAYLDCECWCMTVVKLIQTMEWIYFTAMKFIQTVDVNTTHCPDCGC